MDKKRFRKVVYIVSIGLLVISVLLLLLTRDFSQKKAENEETIETVIENLNHAFELTYNETNMSGKYNELVSLVGKDLAKKLDEISEPVLSQAGDGNKRFEKAEKISIKLGSRNESNNSVPIKVSVFYTTPPIELNTEVSHYQNKNELVLRGRDRFTLTYRIKTNRIELVNFSDNIIEFPTDDYKMGLVNVNSLEKDQRFLELPKQYQGNLKYSNPFDEVDRNYSYSYPKFESTWYVFNRCVQLEMTVPDYLGAGKNWASKESSAAITSEVRAGYVLVVPGGVLGTSEEYGTVCFIEAVHEDGSILVSESGIFGQSYSYMFITKKTLEKCKIIIPENWN